MRLDRESLIVSLAQRLNLETEIVEQVIKEFPKLIYETLEDGGEVYLHGFGRFYTTKLSRRLMPDINNPTQKIVAEPTTIPRFSAGTTFKKQIRKNHD